MLLSFVTKVMLNFIKYPNSILFLEHESISGRNYNETSESDILEF